MMTKTIYSLAAGLCFLFSVGATHADAKHGFTAAHAKPTSGIERARSDARGFGAKQSRTHKKAKVPTSMDLFVDRCTDAGGGLISIDGHYDCVKPSGEPIPNW